MKKAVSVNDASIFSEVFRQQNPMNCILSFPKSPNLDMSLCIPGSSLDAQRIKSRIDQENMFLVRMENYQGVKVDKVYELPSRPKQSPSWKFAITAPALLKKEKGLLFTLKENGLFWELEQEKPSKWVKLQNQVDKDFILASMEIDPTPHKLFCQELLHLEECQKSNVKPSLENQNPWPENWHSKWLDLLLETKFVEMSEKDSVIDKKDSDDNHSSNRYIKFPLEFNVATELLKKLRRGTIVSMAHRCRAELPNAFELMSNVYKNSKVKNDWKSLLELCNK